MREDIVVAMSSVVVSALTAMAPTGRRYSAASDRRGFFTSFALLIPFRMTHGKKPKENRTADFVLPCEHFYFFFLPRCSSRIPSTSSQTGFMEQCPQSVGIPSRIWVRVEVISSIFLARALSSETMA